MSGETTSTGRQGSDAVRQTIEVDIACVGFGPATGGFLTTLNRAWAENPGDPAFESKVAQGMPLQVVCYERADDIAAGVSGVVTRAQGIRASFPELNPADIPMAVEVSGERVLYLLDPVGASRRSFALRIADKAMRAVASVAGLHNHAFELPWTPAFLNKHGGLVMSVGQFNQWVGSQLMASGLVQIWPGTPISEPLFEPISAGRAVRGVRLTDQGLDKKGNPEGGFMPGMDVRALLTVVGDGPVGAVSQSIDRELGTPSGHNHKEWALGMKFVIELPEAAIAESALKPGTVWHTFGYPEPEIFGFLYVHPNRMVSVGIFVPSWMTDPSRTAYRYLQHYIQHPALWRYLKDGTLRSWGAKSLDEAGKGGEPFLTGDGYARIGENSGSTNMLTGSGVDEAWTTGSQLGEAAIELLRAGLPFTQKNLTETYVKRRRASWVETGARESQNARNGFHSGIVKGIIGMAIAGLTGGRMSLNAPKRVAGKLVIRVEEKLNRKEAAALAVEDGRAFHDALLSARGWPEIPFDGRLLVSHQDALLMGGKVQAMAGFADHVVFPDAGLCIACDEKTCISMCSGQAITLGEDGAPAFEREKCVHCGACLWNCAQPPVGSLSHIEFRGGAGGLHSAEN
jgi:electron-transferring-flavoprotein dehydrogenase